uniref:NADH-ubiquinone oxidoreductase chain 3 n=1 Tax=Sperchon placodermus TaxID=3136837 RepID=A0AAU6QDR6_9ACAR
MMISLMIMLSMTMSTILYLVMTSSSKKSKNKKEKSSNFECGFQSQTEKNNQMSSQFFMIAILFLIFDVEIAFILPIPMSETMYWLSNWNIMMIMIILLMGTMMEWKMGMIEWTK